MAVDFITEGNKHNRRTNQYIAQIRDLFKATNRELVSIASLVPVDLDSVFRFRDNQLANNRANREIDALISNIILLLREASTSEQEAANGLITGLLDSMPEPIRTYQPFRETETVETSADTERKVREYVNEYLPAVELNIDTGRRNGYTDTRIVGMLDYSLTRPWPTVRRTEDRIDETNNVALAAGSLLLLSQGGLVNGGIGHYKSSYRNIYRLAMTDLDAVWRETIIRRADNIPIIVGYEIFISNLPNVCYICLDLQGFYPVSFRWDGWHPQCRCGIRPIEKTEEEIEEDARRIERGLEPLPRERSSRYVSLPNRGFYSFIDRNESKLARSYRRGTPQNWVVNNPDYIRPQDFVNRD